MVDLAVTAKKSEVTCKIMLRQRRKRSHNGRHGSLPNGPRVTRSMLMRVKQNRS